MLISMTNQIRVNLVHMIILLWKIRIILNNRMKYSNTTWLTTNTTHSNTQATIQSIKAMKNNLVISNNKFKIRVNINSKVIFKLMMTNWIIIYIHTETTNIRDTWFKMELPVRRMMFHLMRRKCLIERIPILEFLLSKIKNNQKFNIFIN